MHSYERLSGASGRRVFYRAERFKARDLFPQATARVEIDDNLLALEDLSMTGFSAIGVGSSIWAPKIGDEFSVRLLLDDTVIHEGRARVCRIARQKCGVSVGLGLTSDYLDIADVIRKRNRLLLDLEIGRGMTPDTGLVDPAYRKLTADVLHLLRNFRAVLERHESRDNGAAPSAQSTVDEALELCQKRIIPAWRNHWEHANALVEPLMQEPERLRATKRFTELVLTPEFMDGPIWRRSYEKPLGYPGDYQVMNHVYEWQSEGETAIGKLLHHIGLEIGEFVGTRMRMVQQIIADEVANRKSNDAMHVTSIGSGPAKEVSNYLQADAIPAPISFTLIDQEHEALEQAYGDIYPQTTRHRGRATVQCLNMSFVDLAKKNRIFPGVGPQDLIYSMGIIDYLTDHRARGLIASLYDRLAPGGRLVIGNLRKTSSSSLWPMEFICDWSVYYRDEKTMWAMVDGLPAKSRKLETDPTGRVYLLTLRKP
ncbi:MAG: class I SAM-dependent methyltransferase [Rhodospirillales bacterium]|nr:MAG: class I SAM-dependent methyltransferase [Rhodospirillales bacterium]